MDFELSEEHREIVERVQGRTVVVDGVDLVRHCLLQWGYHDQLGSIQACIEARSQLAAL